MRLFGAIASLLIATAAAADQVRAPEISIRPVTRGETQTLVSANRGFDRWIDGFRARAIREGIRPQVYDTAMQGVRYNADVIQRDRNQAEFTKTLWAYLGSAVSESRIQNGRAAMIVAHDLNLAFQACDRWLLLEPGGRWCAGDRDSLADPDRLSRAYGHRIDRVDHNGQTTFTTRFVERSGSGRAA